VFLKHIAYVNQPSSFGCNFLKTDKLLSEQKMYNVGILALCIVYTFIKCKF